MSYRNIFKFFFAFIVEVILGKSTLAQAYKYDRRRIYVLVIVGISLGLNFLTIPRLVSLSYEHYLLLIEYQRVLDLTGITDQASLGLVKDAVNRVLRT